MGYTLPVFACASSIASLKYLYQNLSENFVTINLIKPNKQIKIAIEQVAKIDNNSALAITRSDPGEHLDITKNTPVWSLVKIIKSDNIKYTDSRIEIRGGEGIGIQKENNDRSAIYSYAKELIIKNIEPLLKDERKIIITIILPEGRKLATKTSLKAFGIIDGLSLLGTTGIVQPLTAQSQLEKYQTELIEKTQKNKSLVFCIGENGLDLAQKMGIKSAKIVKTANWLGSMLVVAAVNKVQSILLFGYHGKLIKLAGGIFHTHHHLADGRLEIFTYHCLRSNLPSFITQKILNCDTTESGLEILKECDRENNSNWVETVYTEISRSIDSRSTEYIYKHTEQKILVGSLLFDRSRQIILKSKNGRDLLNELC